MEFLQPWRSWRLGVKSISRKDAKGAKVRIVSKEIFYKPPFVVFNDLPWRTLRLGVSLFWEPIDDSADPVFYSGRPEINQ
jgi:hypothetical protein